MKEGFRASASVGVNRSPIFISAFSRRCILSLSSAAFSKSRRFAASFICFSEFFYLGRYLVGSGVCLGVFLHSAYGVIIRFADRAYNPLYFALYGFRSYPVFAVKVLLTFSSPFGLIHRGLHGAGNVLGVHYDSAVNVPRGPAEGLYERACRAQETPLYPRRVWLRARPPAGQALPSKDLSRLTRRIPEPQSSLNISTLSRVSTSEWRYFTLSPHSA